MSRYHILSWPLWVKFLAAFLVAMIIPLSVLFFVGLQAISQVNQQNLEAYVAESGSRQYTIIANNLEHTITKSHDFSTQANSSFIAQLNLLVSSDNSESRQTYTNNIERIISNVLLADEPFFNGVWLLDLDGELLANVAAGAAGSRVKFDTVGSQANSQAFLTAQALPTLSDVSDTQALVVAERLGQPRLEIVNIVNNSDENPIAYLVVDINIDTSVLDHIQITNSTLPAYTFLAHDSGAIFALPQTLEDNLIFTNTVGVQRAQNRAEGTETYLTGEIGQQQVAGYYRSIPVLNTSLQFIQEIDTNAGIAQTNTTFRAVVFPIFVGLAALLIVLALLMNQLIVPALTQLREAMRGVMQGVYDLPITINQRRDEIGSLATTFVDMRQQIGQLTQDMSQRVEARTHDLATTHEISRIASTQRDLQQLLETAVNLIVARFTDIYHAQIFLTDSTRTMAILRASTGTAGQNLLQRGHRLEVGSMSVIGQVTQHGQTIIARDTGTSEIHKRNEFLLDTRAELAIPLMLGDTMIGALDIQSKEREVFDEDMVRVLQAMADQLSIAIENTRLYEESTRRLLELEQTHQRQTRHAWQNYLYSMRQETLISRAGSPTPTEFDELRQTAQQTAQPAIGELTERDTIPFAIPIRLRGEVLGVVEWELPQNDFNQNQVLLAEELANRLAVSLENARLVQESRQTAERERIVNMVGTQLSQQSDINEILQTAIREVGQALQAPQVNIQLRTKHSIDTPNENGESPPDNSSDATQGIESRSEPYGTN